MDLQIRAVVHPPQGAVKHPMELLDLGTGFGGFYGKSSRGNYFVARASCRGCLDGFNTNHGAREAMYVPEDCQQWNAGREGSKGH